MYGSRKIRDIAATQITRTYETHRTTDIDINLPEMHRVIVELNCSFSMFCDAHELLMRLDKTVKLDDEFYVQIRKKYLAVIGLVPAVREETRKRMVKSLVHASKCADQNCALESCAKMKRAIEHPKDCSRRPMEGCPLCKQLIGLCLFHAKHCNEVDCEATFCSLVKRRSAEWHERYVVLAFFCF